jgi:hypothetical protein
MRTLLIGFLVASVFSSTARAQESHDHRGFWIGFGLGGGWNVSEGLDDRRLAGGAGYVRLGGTPSQRVLLGFEGIGWTRVRTDETLTRGNATFTVMFYPSESGGFFLKGGVGGGSVVRVDLLRPGRLVSTESGFGSTMGLGGDIRLGGNIYLTPNVDWLFQWFDPDDPAVPKTNSILLFTLGLTWH